MSDEEITVTVVRRGRWRWQGMVWVSPVVALPVYARTEKRCLRKAMKWAAKRQQFDAWEREKREYTL